MDTRRLIPGGYHLETKQFIDWLRSNDVHVRLITSMTCHENMLKIGIGKDDVLSTHKDKAIY